MITSVPRCLPFHTYYRVRTQVFVSVSDLQSLGLSLNSVIVFIVGVVVVVVVMMSFD